ncbi:MULTISPECIES: hemerythrin domain-containing protein [unclassified Rhodococcus (in: high G+C Gram-positive bacteria)]|uniref:hemerythrin domain-containing protein n=1 Tax=unclassified Rhodococcus (in: high G+C Gram-positive bacteria) TaxID=192944 RepID=UPI00163A8F85|nr:MULTISPECIES: hemerythrin domain-containing protein [unclassified Rhodococcus (in: high G+C Gram-positive bacteria)]MBC2641193.1 hemerythrin domain-containing protein [Rhodococcus sp. 3A]MBC2894061.1 hemerythrin domain-containing protein [Rhodococcus sp. 4CII]
MPDIIELIFEDHVWFRQQFARLDELKAGRRLDVAAVEAVWSSLAKRLDLHASAEEEIFYPQLLRVGDDDAEAETLDAIGDHNDIRDGVSDAAEFPVASEKWWAAVARTRVANGEHMAEEEREGLADFRTAPKDLRVSLGRSFTEFFVVHPSTSGVDTSDKDPEKYVRDVEQEWDEDEGSADSGSLHIGSLKGQVQ